MFPERSRICWVQTLILGVALLGFPCGMIAQRGGGGGGHIGGGTAGGGGLSGGGKATGLDVKDDLKDFHEALALQANSQQIVEYNLMVKSTENAGAELQTFLEWAARENNASELTARNKVLEQSLEQARTQNTKFLEELSDRQKSGLKETIKKLTRMDSELTQQITALNVEIEKTKIGGQQVASSAQNLQRTLTSFHDQQLALGQEMSIGPRNGQEVSFNIPPVKSSIHFGNQDVAITTFGVISKGTARGDENAFLLELTADISNLQQDITEVLRAQLDKSDACGEQIEIRSATLTPSTPESMVIAQLHYERWACFGSSSHEMVEGNGTIEVRLTPTAGDDGTLRVMPAVGRVDAQGLVGELLRSGSLGEAVRNRIAESLLAVVQQASDYKTMLPPSAQGKVVLRRARFQETGSGKLSFVLDDDIRMSTDEMTTLTNELKASELKASTAKGQTSPAETAPR
ncbi:MAG: hypothetical protein WB660_31360 [Candidatus Sulfotelmatobacter sp.]